MMQLFFFLEKKKFRLREVNPMQGQGEPLTLTRVYGGIYIQWNYYIGRNSGFRSKS